MKWNIYLSESLIIKLNRSCLTWTVKISGNKANIFNVRNKEFWSSLEYIKDLLRLIDAKPWNQWLKPTVHNITSVRHTLDKYLIDISTIYIYLLVFVWQSVHSLLKLWNISEILLKMTVFALAVMEYAVGVSKFGKNPMTLLVHQY